MSDTPRGKQPRALTRRQFSATLTAAAAAATLPFGGAFAQARPLKVGVILPRSGFMAKLGEICQLGADIAGPMLGDLGYPPLGVMQGDTESDVKKAATNAERLIDGGAEVLIGAFDSGQTTAIAAVAEQKGVPLVINIAAAPPITEQGYQFIFRNFPDARKIVGSNFVLQKQLFGATGTAPSSGVLLHVNDTFGTAVAGAISRVFDKFEMPYTLTEAIPYDPKARDLSVEVARAKATGADLLWVVSRLNDAMLLTREMVKQRWEPAGIISSGPGYYEDQYLKTMGRFGDYVISNVPWYDPQKPMTAKLLQAFAAAHPDISVDTNVVYTYEAMLIVADAYKRAGSADPMALQAALRATDITDNVSVGPGIAFNEKGQNEGLGLATVQNFDGKPLVILPKEAAVRDPVFPIPGWNDRG